jgi:hypothetical protein
MIDRVVYHGASDQLVVRLATGDIVQALFVNDGTPREWSQGTAVQVHFPAEALRLLPPRHAGESAPVADKAGVELGTPLEAGAS